MTAPQTVIDWLLDSDPAIRRQVLADLTHAYPAEVAAVRARVELEGRGARLLSLEGDDGLWAGGACFPANYGRAIMCCETQLARLAAVSYFSCRVGDGARRSPPGRGLAGSV